MSLAFSHLKGHKVDEYYYVKCISRFVVSEGIKGVCVRVLGHCAFGHKWYGGLERA